METTKQIVDFGAAGTIRQAAKYFAPKRGVAPSLVAGSSRNLLSPSALEELFLYQRTANGAGGTGAAVFQSIKGNSIVWNQLTPLIGSGAFYASYCTRDVISANEIKITPQDANNNAGIYSSNIGRKCISGHKYYISFDAKVESTNGTYIFLCCAWSFGTLSFALTTAYKRCSIVASASSSEVLSFVKRLNAEVFYLKNFMFIDLTLMFGAGNEPSTVEEFEALFPNSYYAYNPGAILNNAATGMVTDGFNQWDEEWEVGSINGTTGLPEGFTGIRSKNFSPCFGGQKYFGAGSPNGLAIYWYDGQKNYISFASILTEQTAPDNACFFKIRTASDYGTTYNHDICINLSGPRNGQYEPHWSDTTALPITTATGKLNGEGESVVISPNGLAGVGTSFDEAIVEKGMWTKDIIRRARVDLGTLEWTAGSVAGLFLAQISGQKVVTTGVKPNDICSKYEVGTTIAYSTDATDKTIYQGDSNNYIYFKDSAFSGYTPEQVATALAGEELEYELATEQLYILDTTVPVVARVDENGTQTILPQGVDESGVPMTAPFAASIQYPMVLGKEFIGADSLKNLLDAAVEGGAITAYTMAYDEATGAYAFTINQEAAAALAAPSPAPASTE